MRISVIVPVRNAVGTIERTLNSIWSQKHPDVQLIVMDGLSTDGTRELLASYGSRISVFRSQKDCSATEAINNSIDFADGEIVTIIGADDYLDTVNAFSEVASAFADPSIDVVTGSIRVYDPAGLTPDHINKSDPTQLHRKMSVNGQGTFFRTRLFKERKWDLNLKVADDYEFMAYLKQVKRVRFHILDTVLLNFALGGNSNLVKNDFAVARDCFHIRKTYFSTFIAWKYFCRDFSIAVLRRCGFRPLTWKRKVVRLLSSRPT